jgi:hypothetical protein
MPSEAEACAKLSSSKLRPLLEWGFVSNLIGTVHSVSEEQCPGRTGG